MIKKKIIWCDKETLSKDLSGKIYIVTGANSGIGFETTVQLIKQGGMVVMACRRPHSAREKAKVFSNLKGGYEIMELDLTDFDSVRSFVDSFLKKYDRLDGLICNAGLLVMGFERSLTKDGFEETISVNFLGHFLLTELLLDLLKKSKPSRMVIVSSVIHAGSPKMRYRVHLDDLNYKYRKYHPIHAYAEAKVAAVQYAMELAHRMKNSGVTFYSLHPGWESPTFWVSPNPPFGAKSAFLWEIRLWEKSNFLGNSHFG